MVKPYKKEEVAKLNEKFLEAKAGVLADFKGMKVKEMETLRAAFRNVSVDYRVIKNTFAHRASQGTPFETVSEKFVGPVSVAMSYDDVVAPAKVISDFNKKYKDKIKVICGVVEGKKVTPDQIKAIADLPSRDILISRILSAMQGPAKGFVGTLNGVILNFVNLLKAIKDKKEKG